MNGIRDLNFSGPKFELSPGAKRIIIIIFLLTFGIITFLSLVNLAGTLGEYLNSFLKLGFGVNRWCVPIIFLVVGYFMLRPSKHGFKLSNFLGVVIFVLSFNGLLHVIFHQADLLAAAKLGLGGGYLGLVLAFLFLKIMGFWASVVVLLALAVIGLLLLFETSILNWTESMPQKSEQVKSWWGKFGDLKSQRKIKKIQAKRDKTATEEIIIVEPEPEFLQKNVQVEQAGGKYNTKASLAEKAEIKEESEEKRQAKQFDLGVDKFKQTKIDLPLDLLDGKATAPKGGDIKENKLIIQKTFENFGINVEMGDAQVGPTVTQYTLKPAEGVKLSRITTLNDNLSLALAAHPIRIEAPIPGRSLVGIEVPNQATSIVPLADILSSEQFKSRKSNLAVALGKDVMGRPWLAELDRMPHLLIAG
ncbi:MAG: DNA translocase FtsK 4TM domain-containing protein, partial [Candidatus Buchananbacteria bacterium]